MFFREALFLKRLLISESGQNIQFLLVSCRWHGKFVAFSPMPELPREGMSGGKGAGPGKGSAGREGHAAGADA